MPLKEVKKKEFSIPLKEFQEHYSVPGKITDIHYYKGKCSIGEENEEPETVEIYVELE